MLHIHLYVKKKATDHLVVDSQEPNELDCYTSHTCTKKNQINLRIRASENKGTKTKYKKTCFTLIKHKQQM